jgi:hypothetical protein
MLLICCDGFFSKNAFPSPEHVTRFLADPVAFCKDKNFFRGTLVLLCSACPLLLASCLLLLSSPPLLLSVVCLHECILS